MTLDIIGNISRYYAETLCLLFFPGSKFPEKDGGEPYVRISLEYKDNLPFATAVIKAGEKTEEFSFHLPLDSYNIHTKKTAEQLAVGRAMIGAGEKFCGFKPSWGALTGVRPAKTAKGFLDSLGEDAAKTVLCRDFGLSETKARVAINTARIESKFITDEVKKHCSVYVAIPFCPTKCAYCSFVSFSSDKLLSLIPLYLERLLLDITNIAKIIKELNLKVDTIYIGGGTPTTLTAKQLELLLCHINNSFDVANISEFTLEAGRPDTITAEKFEIAKKYGVTRVSVNAQTMNGEILQKIGRKHTPSEFLEAFHVAKNSGIPNINVDLIAGLPDESYESFCSSVEQITDLSPENITIHSFYVKRAAEWSQKNCDIYRAEDMTTEKDIDFAQNRMLSGGYVPYYLYKQKNTRANLENTGFAKIGHECLYNIYMMEEVHTVFGAGASSMTKFVPPEKCKAKIVRMAETKYPYEYLDSTKSDAEKRYHFLLEQAKIFYESYNK